MLRSSVLTTFLLGVAITGCGGGGGGNPADPDAAELPVDAPVDALVIPVLRNPVALPDLELAQQASALLGVGGGKNCDRCHALTRDRLRAWDTQSDAAESSCLTGHLAPTTQAEAAAIVDCFLETPGLVASGWPPHKLGIFNTAARLPWFEYVFGLAYGADGPAQLELFVGEAAMPRGDTGWLTQPEFDVVAEWFARGLPQLEAVVAADPPPTTCTTSITPEVQTHVTAMRTQGWRAINQENGILMHGCAGAATARDCLGDYPKAADNDFSTGWDAPAGSTIRVLRQNSYASSYWTRSSADGRYVAHGGAAASSQTYRSTVIDLVNDTAIPAAALYDPGFWPDNSGFALQGGSARFCEQGLLATQPAMITFNEPQCYRTQAVGLYQHMGAAHGGDYWTVDGQFTNDNGGQINGNVTLSDPSSSFAADADIDLVAMVHTGTQFMPRTTVTVSVPREGDVVMSPSARLLVSRVSAGNGQSGYIMRKLVATPSGDGYTVNVPEIARYCVRGAKPALSYDERWMVYHHYVEANDWAALGYASASDPGFVALRQSGAANVYLMEITTGEIHRVTTMQPGQYALYPHFRSDGWIYFLVRDRDRNLEWVVASDAALMLE